jgi:hypothetical protein
MQSKVSSFLLILIAFLGGFVLMSVELIYPRISAIWFGNILEIWAVDLSMALLVIAAGYRTGTYLLSRFQNNAFKMLIIFYTCTVMYFFIIPHLYSSILDSLLSFSTVTGAVFFALLFMIPTMGVLAVTSPLLIEIVNQYFLFKNATPFLFGASSIGGALAMLLIGLYFLPYFGIELTCYMLATILTFNLFFIFYIKVKTKFLPDNSNTQSTY